jgi:hypothetical protein
VFVADSNGYSYADALQLLNLRNLRVRTMAQQHQVGQGLMIVVVPRLHSDTPTKIGTTPMGERLAGPTDIYLTTQHSQ